MSDQLSYRVMLVEDDPKIARILAEALERYGMTVTAVDDFARVKEAFCSCEPDLVLLDINLSRYDGYYWCRQIRALSRVPIIFISARDQDIDQVRALESGGDDYISKPFSLELALTVKPDEAGRLVNPGRHLLYTLVVSDVVYEGLADRVAPGQRIHISMWTGSWRGKAMQQASSELVALFEGQEKKLISTTIRQYQTQVTQTGLVVFIEVFVSLVFVAACFSLLYSRLFTDIEEDRRHACRLQQVGVTRRELRGQALSQMAVIFFLPFVVGLVHSTVAMHALGTLTRRTVLHYGWGAALLFLFLFGAFFSGTGQLYWRSLQDGLRRGEPWVRTAWNG